MSELYIGPENTRYPERADPGNRWRQRWERNLTTLPVLFLYDYRRRQFAKNYAIVEAAMDDIRAMSDRTFRDAVDDSLTGLRRRGLWQGDLSVFIALFLDSQRRGGFKPLTPEQCLQAFVMLKGMAVEEGSCTAPPGLLALVAVAAAMSGRKVQLLTADDALSQQLAHDFRTLLDFFPLEYGLVESNSSLQQRRNAYRMPICIASAREALHDYLEDRLQLKHLPGDIGLKLARLAGNNPLQNARMQGLDFGILVDAEQFLIDQACTPMVIARESGSGEVTPRAKLTFQRFFRRYRHLTAACHDIRHIRAELWQVYGLATVPAPGKRTPPPDPGEQDSAKERRQKAHLRRRMLQLDDQVGNLTSFSGPAE